MRIIKNITPGSAVRAVHGRHIIMDDGRQFMIDHTEGNDHCIVRALVKPDGSVPGMSVGRKDTWVEVDVFPVPEGMETFNTEALDWFDARVKEYVKTI